MPIHAPTTAAALGRASTQCDAATTAATALQQEAAAWAEIRNQAIHAIDTYCGDLNLPPHVTDQVVDLYRAAITNYINALDATTAAARNIDAAITAVLRTINNQRADRGCARTLDIRFYGED